MEDKPKHKVQRVNMNLLTKNVANLDVEAQSKRLNRTQMLEQILEERYKSKLK